MVPFCTYVDIGLGRARSGLARRALMALLAGSAALAASPDANACGCLSPPATSTDDYAVNQQAEQIIFEVEPGFVTAHVLIRYAGDPEKFAWIVPVPANPEMSLSPAAAFGILDEQTAPSVRVDRQSLCPSDEYVCEYHPPPSCPSDFRGGAGSGGSAGGGFAFDASSDAGAGAFSPGEIEVYQRAQIGSYDTVVFGAGDSAGAVTWLQTEGFIVNDTMAPYMQPYVDAGMLFVAAKLVPGADADEIKPLRMRYAANQPMIPLQLTAVAAEPHLTVTSYIYGSAVFEPVDHPLLGLDQRFISETPSGRSNYPMVAARAIDDAGGDGFIMEYAGDPPTARIDDPSGCCGDEFDRCGIELDGLCQCPASAFDADDCAEETELVDSFELVNMLASKHAQATRLTTRISPEEMTFDPAFRPMTEEPPVSGRLSLRGTRNHMDGCEADIIDRDLYDAVTALQDCASVYCGKGECVATASGPACACDTGFVAREFTDLDGQASITCIPEVGTVDFEAGGLSLASACTGVDCGHGSCVDVGGFPSCRCDADAAAVVLGGSPAPTCRPRDRAAASPGARDFSVAMDDVRACAPTPRECGQFGWLVPNPNITRQGVICPSSLPRPEAFEVAPMWTCEEYYGTPSNFGGGGPPVSSQGGPFDDVTPGAIPDGRGGDWPGNSTISESPSDVSGGGGCGCTTPGSNAANAGWPLAILGAAFWLARRRRRGAAASR